MKEKNEKNGAFDWKNIKEKLKTEINESAYKAWFANMDLEEVNGEDVRKRARENTKAFIT
ncbi:MAG: DnaA N-terminal domain-containing protein [candidate division WOR-3 bacterium]